MLRFFTSKHKKDRANFLVFVCFLNVVEGDISVKMGVDHFKGISAAVFFPPFSNKLTFLKVRVKKNRGWDMEKE